MASVLSWQMSDEVLKSMEPIRDKEPRSTTDCHVGHSSPLLSLSALILLPADLNGVCACIPLRPNTSEATKTPGFINPKGRRICTRALGNYFRFHGVLSGNERSTYNYDTLPLLLLFFFKQWFLRNTGKWLVFICIYILNMPCRESVKTIF